MFKEYRTGGILAITFGCLRRAIKVRISVSIAFIPDYALGDADYLVSSPLQRAFRRQAAHSHVRLRRGGRRRYDRQPVSTGLKSAA